MNTLSLYERSYIDQTGYWTENMKIKRHYEYLDNVAKKLSLGDQKEIHISLQANECYVPGANAILSEYPDIASLFASKKLLKSFLNFLFTSAMKEKINEMTPYYYHQKSQVYNFDYNYILFMIIAWGTTVLKADKIEMINFMSIFKAGSNQKYLHSNYFLIKSIFSDTHNLIYMKYIKNPRKIYSRKMARAAYCNSTIIRNIEDGKEYFFQAIPIDSNKILLHCSEDIIQQLLEQRELSNIEQLYFGKEVNEKGDREPFLKLDFKIKLDDS